MEYEPLTLASYKPGLKVLYKQMSIAERPAFVGITTGDRPTPKKGSKGIYEVQVEHNGRSVVWTMTRCLVLGEVEQSAIS